jgi:hypothetical protein
MKYAFAADVNSREKGKEDGKQKMEKKLRPNRFEISACPRDFIMRDCAA